MHEYALAKSLLNRAVLEAARQGSYRIASLTISVGGEGDIDKDALSFNLRAAAWNTPAAGAEVHLITSDQEGIVLTSLELEEVSDVSGSTGPGSSEA
ncbi:MAG: hydrogenase/urease maturation nickel metallochaperone HypA [Dehalococcoidia bacterium]